MTQHPKPDRYQEIGVDFNADPRVPVNPPIGGWHRVTAESVLDQQFEWHGLPVLGWGGYDETEVDDTLDQVWATLSRYEQNNELLEGLAGQLEQRGDVTSRDFATRIREVLAWPKT